MRADTTNAWLVWNQSSAVTAGTANLVQPYTLGSATVSQCTAAADWYNWVGLQEASAELRVEFQRDQAVRAQQQRDVAAARKTAAERAEQLLLACLSLSQRESLQKEGWFVVFTKRGRGYQIRRGRAGNVIEVNTKRRYCCHPIDGVPDADTMLAQKLMLETQEDEFLRLANVS